MSSGSLSVGDVLIHEGVDLLLTGSLTLHDGPTAVATLFFAAMEKGASRVVVEFPRPRTELLWLMDTEEAARGGEPPLVLETTITPSSHSHPGDEHVTVDRTRRLGVTTAVSGEGAPRLGESVVFAEFQSTDARAIMVVGAEGTLVATGWRVRRDEIDRLPGS